MDKKNLFKFNLYVSLVFLVETALCTDDKFEACEPQNCGIGPNISYPFWIHDRQESYCGYPGFELVCNEDMPILRISEDDYVIHQIFYQNQSLLVSNAVLKANSCSLPIHNVTIENTNLFEFGPSQSNISLFSNCVFNSTKDYTNQTVGCSSDDADHRSVVLFDQDPRLNYLKNSSVCKSYVVTPFRRDADTSIRTITQRTYVELLMEGFVLEWNVINCSRCEYSGGRCGYNSTESIFQCFCPDRPHRVRCQDSKKKIAAIVGIGIGAGIIGISIALLTIYICLRMKRRSTSSVISKNISSDPSSKSDRERGSMYFGVHMFTYSELEEATENFNPSKELGDGGFGTVYLGKLRDGRLVAVKRLYEHNYKRVEQFLNEVEILTRLHHQNLVTLYGCTSRRSRELLLVYEYMPNGTVADHLHGDQAKPGSLSWPTRLNIAIETASALAYLHASDVIHRDVKTNNILLDNNFHVKVADFGLSRLFPMDVTHVSTAPQGTPGYVDPEYHQCYHLTVKSDVYSFGVVLIELISSLPAVDINRHRHEINLANRAINKIQTRSFHELVDPSLGFEETYAVKRMITLVAELAFRCLQAVREMRPSMKEVLEALRGIESDDYREEKKEELDNREDDVSLLKNIPPPPSPDTVTAKWVSRSSTPNTSNLIFKVGSKSMS